jgi:hypothetical protein
MIFFARIETRILTKKADRTKVRSAYYNLLSILAQTKSEDLESVNLKLLDYNHLLSSCEVRSLNSVVENTS